jgi:hypothetical protein
MNCDLYSRSIAIAAVLAAASVFSEPAPAQTMDGGGVCWVNTGTGIVYDGPNLPALPAGTTETSPGQRSGGDHEYTQVTCPPPGLPQPAPRNRPAPAATPP